MSLCPHCKKTFTAVTIKDVKAKVAGGRTFNAISYNCPHVGCGFSLGVEIDPIALKTDIVRDVIAGLRGR